MPEGVAPGVAKQTLAKMLMEIDYASGVEGKLRQLDARITALLALEREVHARIVGHPALRGGPLPPAPPPEIAREFAVLTATATALDKLTATRAALARLAGPPVAE